jgi:membrane protein DedA with SNARE-associated domain
MLDAFLDWLAGLPGALTYVVLIALSALENVFPPVPADVAVALGAFLSQRGVTSAPLLGFLCWVGNTASSAGVYALARRRADFFRRGWPSRWLTPAVMATLEDAYRRHGVLGIFISRFFPGLRAAVTPFAGMVRLSPARALVPSALASAIWYALLTGAGVWLGQHWDHVRHVVEKVTGTLGLAGFVLTLLIVLWIGRRARRVRPEE